MADRKARVQVHARRSDGERTHASILQAAAEMASVEGLDGLTIGRLAEALGISKSGLYAHFGSKEQLQRETLEAALGVIEREVIGPALSEPPGLGRLRALCAAYLSYVERKVFPGGCFFATTLAEMDARTGPIRELAAGIEDEWRGLLAASAEEARATGELRADVDSAQVAFELEACLELANYHYTMFDDPIAIERGRTAIEGILGRATAR